MTGLQLTVGILLGVLVLMGIKAFFVWYVVKKHDQNSIDSDNFGEH